ncbi:MAG: TolC family protein [Myxococcota bacterium]|jgi:outer membrane protein TolC|nr:TolC family protein [Myxococcota bacterium]
MSSLNRAVLALLCLLLPLSSAMGEEAPRALSLEQALLLADSHFEQRLGELDLQSTQTRIASSEAGLYPQLSVSADFSAGVRGNTGEGYPDPSLQHGFDLGLGIRQLVYDFGRIDTRVRSLEASIEAQQSQLERMRAQRRLLIELLYWQTLAAEALLEVAEESVANRQKHLERIAAFVELDTRPPIDLVQAQVDLATASTELEAARIDVSLAKLQLSESMGVDWGADFELLPASSQQTSIENESSEALLSRALESRVEFRAQAARRQQLELELEAAELSNAPVISASAGLQEGFSVDEIDAHGWSVSAAIGIQWSFYDGGATQAAVDEASIAILSLELEEQMLKLQVMQELEAARLEILSNQTQLQSTQAAVLGAQERLALAEGRYENGVGSIIELSDAALSLSSARSQQVRAELSLAAARAKLKTAVGDESE